MYSIILCAVICILISFLATWNDIYDVLDIVLTFFMSALVGCAIGIFIGLALPMDTYDRVTTLKMESLQDNNSVSGHFVLGSGVIDGRMKYVFYYNVNDYYCMKQVDYEDAIIKYSEGNPKVEIHETFPTKSILNEFAIDTDIYDCFYVIYVPKGSIKNNYILDAQ